MAARVAVLLALAMLIFANAVRADDPLWNQVKPADAVARADTVFIGKVFNLDEGMTEDDAITVSVNTIQALRGKVVSPIVFVIGTNAKRCAGGITLKTAGSYIFFLNKANTALNLFKILPATDENVSLVKKLISN